MRTASNSFTSVDHRGRRRVIKPAPMIGISRPRHDVLETALLVSQICLTPKARALGHELTAWSVGLATSGENYIIDKLGGRLYGSAKAEQLAFLVLEELGLCGLDYNMKRFLCAQAIIINEKIFLIPISYAQGMPLAVMHGSQAVKLRLGYCYVILGDFRLTSGLDCLLVAKYPRT